MRFKIDWASLIVGSKFTVFALFYFVFEGNFQVQAPRGGGAYIWRGDLTEGFLRYEFGGLIFGAAYTWRGLFSEFYGTLIFYQILSTNVLKKCRENSLENLHVAVVDPGESPPPPFPYFWTKMRPKGPKKFFGGDRPPLISRSGSGTV